MNEQHVETSNTIEFDPDTQTNRTMQGYEVRDLREEEAPALADWMTRLLLKKEFQMVPARNLQSIFSKLLPTQYKAGVAVIEQGNPGEFFYIITSGRCAVTRELAKDRGAITLAELTVGDTFGEEALITNATRQATVSMLTNGTVMKLSKDDFITLLSEPIVTHVDVKEAQAIIAKGGVRLDVSSPSIPSSIARDDVLRIPMHILRLKLDQLDKTQHIVVTSSDNTQGCAAAHILSQYGFNVSTLQIGLDLEE